MASAHHHGKKNCKRVNDRLFKIIYEFEKSFIVAMKFVMKNIFIFLFFIPFLLHAQQYDLLIKNGHVIDPKNNIDAVKDIAIANGKIAKVDNNISATESKKTIDATGLYVVPGLID